MSMDHLVVDSGAIIKGVTHSYYKTGLKMWTVSEVLAEIRDSKSRDILLALPFELEIRTPSEKSMMTVSSFTRKTGDFSALSLCDLKVLALTYDIELENNGSKYIRDAPTRLDIAAQKSNKPKKQKALEVKEFAIGANDVPCGCDDNDLIIKVETAPQNNNEITIIEQDDVCNRGPENEEGIDGQNNEDYDVHDSEEDSEEHESDNADSEDNDNEKYCEDDATTNLILSDIKLEEIGDNNAPINDHATEESKAESIRHVHFVQLEDSDHLNHTESHHADQITEEFSLFSGDFPELSSHAINPSSGTSTNTSTSGAVLSGWSKIISSSSGSTPNPSTQLKKTNTTTTIRPTLLDQMTEGTGHQATTGGAPEDYRHTSTPSYVGNGTTQPSRIIGLGGSGVGLDASRRQQEEDDGVGWVGPTNIQHCMISGNGMIGRAQSAKKTSSKSTMLDDTVDKSCSVSCVTTDFTMQNVLLQMGLDVMSVEGVRVTQIRQFVLRCGACYKVHYDMDRLFCSKCGSHLMQRIAASINSKTGILQLHLKKNYHHNTKGMIYSLPNPGKQGKYSGELLLREDQMLVGIWKQKVVNIKKDVRSQFGDEITSDVGIQINKSNKLKIGLGSKNPNAQKGRERRGKKKK